MAAVTNTRGLVIRIKELMPERLFRTLTRPVAAFLKVLPTEFKYKIGLRQRRNNYPYRLIKDGDLIMQIGAPRDLLKVGRSRSIYFLKMVGSGKVIVFEPDPDSGDALQAFADKHGLADRLILVRKGAWNKDEELVFLSSPTHPAANLIQGAQDIDQSILDRRQYNEIRVPVTSVDAELERQGLPAPKLISITANGAEPQIIEGLTKTIANGVKYLALALTGENYPEKLDAVGYDLVANDDRGFTFERRADSAST
jgi:FkbM family methyltransferase